MRLAAAIALSALLTATSVNAQDSKGSETTETLGQGLSATNSGIGNLGKAADGLKGLTSGAFVGQRVMKGAGKAAWNGLFNDVRKAAEASKNSVGFAVAAKALWFNDLADGVVAPLVEGDGRGAVSGAVNIAINDAVVSAGTVGVAALGAAIGSVIPIAGTAAGASLGTMVGGAIGTVAGGFVSSLAFDRYGKALVAKGVEGVIASLFDTGDLQKAMNARRELWYAQASPELQKVENDLSAVSESFGNESVELLGPGSSPYIVAKPDAPAATGEDVLAGVTKFELMLWSSGRPDTKGSNICQISGRNFSCRGEDRDACGVYTHVISGTVQGGHLAGSAVYDSRMGLCSPCKSNAHGASQATPDLSIDGKARGAIGPNNWHETSQSGACGTRALAHWTSPGGPMDGTWRAIP